MEIENLSDNLYFWCFLLPPYHLPDFLPKEKKYSDYVKPVLEANNWNIFITITDDLFLKFDVLNLHSDIENYLKNEIKMVWVDIWRFDVSSICIDYINIFQLFLLSEYIWHKHFWAFTMNEITRNKLIWCKANPSGYENIDLNCDPYTNILSNARHWFLYTNKYSCDRISYEFWKYFNKEYFSSAINKYLKVIDDEKARNSLAHFSNCLFEYYKWNFADTFILTRFYIESHYRKIRERKEWKTSEKETIYSIIEDLHDKWDLSDINYWELTTFRKHRNLLAHNYQKNKWRDKTSQEMALSSLSFCLGLINQEFKLNITFDPYVNLINYSHSIPYL